MDSLTMLPSPEDAKMTALPTATAYWTSTEQPQPVVSLISGVLVSPSPQILTTIHIFSHCRMMCNLVPEYLPLPQLHQAMHHLAAHAFCPGTSRNHALQAQSFIQFCDHYHLHFLDPDGSTACLYITYLTHWFSLARSLRNYVSGVRILLKHAGRTPAALESYQVSCLL